MAKFGRDAALYFSRLPEKTLLHIDVCRGGLGGSRCIISQHSYGEMKRWRSCRLFCLPHNQLLIIAQNNRTLLFISTKTWKQVDYKMVGFDVVDVRVTPDGIVHYADKDGVLHVIDTRKTLVCKCQTVSDTVWTPRDSIGQQTIVAYNTICVYRHTGVMWQCAAPGQVVTYAVPQQGRAEVYLAGFFFKEKELSIVIIKNIQ